MFDINQQNGVLLTAISLANAASVITFSVRVSDRAGLYINCDVRVVLTSSDLSNLPVFVNPPDENTTYHIPEVRHGLSILTETTLSL